MLCSLLDFTVGACAPWLLFDCLAMTYSEQRQAAGQGGSSWSSGASSGKRNSSGGGGSSYRSSGTSRSAAAKRGSLKKNKSASIETSDINAAWDAEMVVRAKWDYSSDHPSDLNFHRGDQIVVLTSTGNQEDWWEGKLRGKVGIFPANYVASL